MKLTLIPVEPIGTKRTAGFVTRESGCGFEEWDQPYYPVSRRGIDLRAARVGDRDNDGYLNLREAAALLGVRPVDISKLETGVATLTDEEWRAAIAALNAARAAKEPTK